MLSRHGNKQFLDLSPELSDELDWKAATLRSLVHHLDITALAYEPVSGILAVGTSKGFIDLYGDQARGVEHRLELSEPLRVRSLHFAASLFRLICVDERDRLTIWDLSATGKPKVQSIVGFRHPVNCIATSPSHTHIFAALSNGEIHTYDLLCSRMSPYQSPNMWALYEEKVVSRGEISAAGAGSRIPVDMVIHPRDLNTLFVAYGGGVIAVNLTEQSTVHAYEYILPPGAPGGAGFHEEGLLKHRRPEVTALTVHPTGHVFAVGYMDGSIAIWATEDEDKPLISFTLDGQHDIHTVDAAKLDAILAKPKDPSDGPREPIFKLAWSGFPNSTDPRGATTVLTALGGLRSDEAPGITTLAFPPFNPPEPPVPPAGSSVTLDQPTRSAMRVAVTPEKSYLYPSAGIPQDFLLLPKDSPHFSGTWDPTAILLLSDGRRGARVVEAYHFPPPCFVAELDDTNLPPPETPIEGTDPNFSREIASTLELFKSTDDPRPLRTPPSLWSGPSGVISGHIVNLERDSFEVLTADHTPSNKDAISLRGGSAWVDDVESEMKLMKFQPRRMLITRHADLTVRFRDLSAQILVSSDTSPMQASFPDFLPELTIDLVPVLADPVISTRTSPKFVEDSRIVSSHIAPQSLECAVVLQNGAVVVHKLAQANNQELRIMKELDNAELVSVSHVAAGEGRRFQPYFVVLAERGPVSAVGMSDIGFLAVSYVDGSLFVVDMRGPHLLFRNVGEGQRRSFLHRNDADPVQALTWTVSGTDSNPQQRVLLIVVRASGTTSIYSLARSNDGSWAVNPTPENTDSVTQPLPDSSFVIDTKTGKNHGADRGTLGAALMASSEDLVKGKTIWICAGVKGVRCVVDITGERIGRAEWPSKLGKVDRVSVVQKNAGTVLVAHTDRREALVYSLPYLEHMHSLQLHQTSPEPLSLDGTGDYIEWLRHPCGLISTEKYGTLFSVRRSGPYKPPQVDLAFGRAAVPAQPQPVAIGPPTLLGSMWGYIAKNMTGDQLDALLAGPDRPIPPPKVQPARPKPSSDTPDSNAASTSSARDVANSASRATNSLYDRLNAALAERGEMLDGLQESFNSLESGSKNMLEQAKTMAAKQTAKRWFQLS